ncbi:phospholipid phosphatase 6 isoform X2 [Bombyx mandarina]|nr:phospholipid phosphatase 6 isoform X2 [Bombyx mandarina]XP_028037687.1 phospholipid phosphatase 6 isoform X2 [Bombyx mandarina]XP_028037688.1 phospholipid phosphatase 6 isoform X2 [Bombyx mandarina]XP_037871985.1 phospholipid phosphatase 6 isoform X2 [Bombyx mori]XP_037871986.1 phospholipid phosphatase 6 isoform X2 [Bombyx mori]XP_037871987.1 phospholipid phosphatase 6 isoform X2 [Bombyx mori]XP_037877320.1 phospholipid phosphatase 6 isoform X2 [Bombyx mori]XP_037877321.1 phospholipid pho
MLKKILQYDVQITKTFVDRALKITALKSLRNHSQLLEISCHGIVWLAGWLTFIWLFNSKDLYQLQVNMLIALILDIVVVAVLKAFVRRRRPVPMNKLMEVGPDKFSFPSGHASRAVLISFILIYFDSVSIIFYPPLMAWVVSVSISRVLAERHYLLDSIGGVGIGILEGLFMSLIWLSQSTSASILSSLSDEKLDGGEYHV